MDHLTATCKKQENFLTSASEITLVAHTSPTETCLAPFCNTNSQQPCECVHSAFQFFPTTPVRDPPSPRSTPTSPNHCSPSAPLAPIVDAPATGVPIKLSLWHTLDSDAIKDKADSDRQAPKSIGAQNVVVSPLAVSTTVAAPCRQKRSPSKEQPEPEARIKALKSREKKEAAEPAPVPVPERKPVSIQPAPAATLIPSFLPAGSRGMPALPPVPAAGTWWGPFVPFPPPLVPLQPQKQLLSQQPPQQPPQQQLQQPIQHQAFQQQLQQRLQHVSPAMQPYIYFCPPPANPCASAAADAASWNQHFSQMPLPPPPLAPLVPLAPSSPPRADAPKVQQPFAEKPALPSAAVGGSSGFRPWKQLKEPRESASADSSPVHPGPACASAESCHVSSPYLTPFSAQLPQAAQGLGLAHLPARPSPLPLCGVLPTIAPGMAARMISGAGLGGAGCAQFPPFGWPFPGYGEVAASMRPSSLMALEGHACIGDKRRLGDGKADAGDDDTHARKRRRRRGCAEHTAGGEGEEVAGGNGAHHDRGSAGESGEGAERGARGKGDGGEEKECSNCGTHTTPFWRKDRAGGGQHLCNACGLYLAKNDVPRPAVLWKRDAHGSHDTASHDSPLREAARHGASHPPLPHLAHSAPVAAAGPPAAAAATAAAPAASATTAASLVGHLPAVVPHSNHVSPALVPPPPAVH
ncbi:unnamed protein product [Closterium sp. NIES-54]